MWEARWGGQAERPGVGGQVWEAGPGSSGRMFSGSGGRPTFQASGCVFWTCPGHPGAEDITDLGYRACCPPAPPVKGSLSWSLRPLEACLPFLPSSGSE